jgi:hypothetical protein
LRRAYSLPPEPCERNLFVGAGLAPTTFSSGDDTAPRARPFCRSGPAPQLAARVSLDLVPILEEKVLGYELTAIGDAETCLTLGCKPDGEPVLRKETLSNALPRALQLVALDGRTIARPP